MEASEVPVQVRNPCLNREKWTLPSLGWTCTRGHIGSSCVLLPVLRPAGSTCCNKVGLPAGYRNRWCYHTWFLSSCLMLSGSFLSGTRSLRGCKGAGCQPHLEVFSGVSSRLKRVAWLRSQVLLEYEKKPVLPSHPICALIEAGPADLDAGSFRNLR
jgi:hypothetical protein